MPESVTDRFHTATQPIPFDNSYARLPAHFFARVMPTRVAAPARIRVNEELARTLGIDPVWLASDAAVATFAGNAIPDGAEPLAMAYAGHQFGGPVPQLGDGRAILLGEVVGRDGVRRDIQLKGAGRTPYSRMGDGRAVLGPVLREYILSEAMAALGIPTTRALAAVLTGDTVMREAPLPGAVFTRVARGHVRFGTFEWFRNRADLDGLRTLADYVVARHYPELDEKPDRYGALLATVAVSTAELVAKWMMVGFIHGVMNTDNMSVAAETIDYGPCAFMDTYHSETVYSSIDAYGRYAYGNQPRIAHWNLVRLAETLLPLLDAEPEAAAERAKAALDQFKPAFEAAYRRGLRAKLGLFEEREGDVALAHALLERMAQNHADFTLSFRHLSDAAAPGAPGEAAVRALFDEPAAFDAWAESWRARLAHEGGATAARATAMRQANPAFIPRNHRVQAVIAAAQDHHDFEPFETLLAVLARPFEDQPDHADYAQPPRPDEIVQQTFCGT